MTTNPQKVLSAIEPWAEYQLEDGTTIRLRLTACNFKNTGKLSDQGDPLYSFAHVMQCETAVKPSSQSLLRLIRESSDQTDAYVGPAGRVIDNQSDAIDAMRTAQALPLDAG